MEYWVAHKNGKVLEQIEIEKGEEKRWSTDENATRVQVSRPGCLSSELFDADTSSWIPNPEYAAFEVDFNLGPEHKAKAHMQKVMEAKLLQIGLEVDGLLKKESEAIGVPLQELADTVLARNEVFEQTEISRREIKKGVK